MSLFQEICAIPILSKIKWKRIFILLTDRFVLVVGLFAELEHDVTGIHQTKAVGRLVIHQHTVVATHAIATLLKTTHAQGVTAGGGSGGGAGGRSGPAVDV